MYSCVECGALYEPDGITRAKKQTGYHSVFAMIWTCPVCVEKAKMNQFGREKL